MSAHRGNNSVEESDKSRKSTKIKGKGTTSEERACPMVQKKLEEAVVHRTFRESVRN